MAKKILKLLVIWEEVPIGFARYFIAKIQKQKILEVEVRKLRAMGVDGFVKEKLGVDSFEYLVVDDDDFVLEEIPEYE
jgi:hypothetical protein